MSDQHDEDVEAAKKRNAGLWLLTVSACAFILTAAVTAIWASKIDRMPRGGMAGFAVLGHAQMLVLFAGVGALISVALGLAGAFLVRGGWLLAASEVLIVAALLIFLANR